jgi:ribosomal protein S18 acetylase RimI-like enzyme
MEISQFSRYNFDDKFQRGEGGRLYRAWIRNSLSALSDVVFVARWKGNPEDAVGVITCITRQGVGHIQLAGVDHEHRQRGVGTGLVQAALDWARNQAATRMQVATQARNVAAQRLYQQMGFFTKSITLFYHKWL